MDKIIYSKKDELIFNKLTKQGPLGKRALFIFQYLFLRKEFKDLIKSIRKMLDIPEDGFDPHKKEDVDILLNKYITNYRFEGEIISQKRIDLISKNVNANRLIEKYIEQCGVLAYTPNMYLADSFIMAIIKEYILFNDFIGLYKGNFALTSVASYEDDTTGTENQQEPKELRIEIPISAKKEEIIDYINETWEALEFTRKKILSKKDFVRFRPRANFIRDIQIFNKYLEIEKLSKRQRKDKFISYIELGVVRELKKEGMKNIPDSGTIRSIISRLRNEIKDKNAFWEEQEDEIIKPKTVGTNLEDF